MGKIVGIDLGTTNSVVAVLESGEPKVINNEEGSRITPSVVGFAESGEVLVGEIARRQAIMNPENTVYSIKRFMGRRSSEVSGEASRVPYHIVSNSAGQVEVKVREARYRPEEISARVLQKLKRSAELYLGEPVTAAVITVPAYFNDAQRQATKDAGEIAGLEVKRIINEPTAAALCYGLDKNVDELIAVYDFGGGTLDISLLEVGKDVVEVLATHGDTHLGGDNIDNRIVTFLLEQFKEDTGLDVSEDRVVMQRLREAAERAKIELSSILETDINLPFLTADAKGPRHLNVRLTRARLEAMIGELVERSIESCKQALSDAGKKPSDVAQVLLVGGTTRIPLIQRCVSEFFGREPHRGLNPDEVVAMGAAIQGGVLGGDIDSILLLDVTPLSLGVAAQGGIMVPLIPRNTTIPTKRTKRFSTVTDNQTRVEIQVYQGERDFVADNRLLGKVELNDIPPAPRATPEIEVSFDLDANGILSVSAEEKRTGKAASITIKDSGGLNPDEIQSAIQQAAVHENADRERRRVVEQRNRITSLIFSIQQQRISADNLPPALAEQLDNALASAREAESRDENNLDVLHEVLEALRDAAAALTAHLNPAAAPAEPDAEDAEEPSEDSATEDSSGPTAEDEAH